MVGGSLSPTLGIMPPPDSIPRSQRPTRGGGGGGVTLRLPVMIQLPDPEQSLSLQTRKGPVMGSGALQGCWENQRAQG